MEGHLTFALKYEGLDLAVLKHLFVVAGPSEIEAVVRAKPTGSYARRIWFLYEWLIGTRLDRPDAPCHERSLLPGRGTGFLKRQAGAF